jgi:hypothetical protein
LKRTIKTFYHKLVNVVNLREQIDQMIEDELAVPDCKIRAYQVWTRDLFEAWANLPQKLKERELSQESVKELDRTILREVCQILHDDDRAAVVKYISSKDWSQSVKDELLQIVMGE